MQQPMHEWSVVEVLAALRTGRIDAEVYLQHLLDRCAQHTHLDAFICLEPQRILTDARSADAARRAGMQGELLGLPIAIKDNIAAVGCPTTAGTRDLARYLPAQDADVVAELKRTGAIAFGKTNMHELGFGFTGENAHYGITRNPYARTHIAGGSSSGSAAAVAARLVPAALGTDTSGSLRVPAALCGVVGFRPSAGRYSGRGVVPIAPTRDTVGLITRQVSDALVLDGVITGDRQQTEPEPALSGLRLGVPKQLFYEDLDHEVGRAMEAELSRLSHLGAVLIEANLPGVRDWAARCRPIIDHELAVASAAYLAQIGTTLTLADLIKDSPTAAIRRLVDAPFLREGGGVSVQAYQRCLADEREDIRAACAHYFEAHDVRALIFPTTPAPACRVQDALDATSSPATNALVPYGRNTTPASIAGLPALTLPLALNAAGLPIGLELDGPSGSDRALLALGAALEGSRPRLPPPALHA